MLWLAQQKRVPLSWQFFIRCLTYLVNLVFHIHSMDSSLTESPNLGFCTISNWKPSSHLMVPKDCSPDDLSFLVIEAKVTQNSVVNLGNRQSPTSEHLLNGHTLDTRITDASYKISYSWFPVPYDPTEVICHDIPLLYFGPKLGPQQAWLIFNI